MTLAEIESSDKSFLTPAEAAPVLGVDPHSIRMQARIDPDKLGFPVVVTGTRTRIPRVAFLDFVKGEGARCSMRDDRETYLAEKWNALITALEEFAAAYGCEMPGDRAPGRIFAGGDVN